MPESELESMCFEYSVCIFWVIDSQSLNTDFIKLYIFDDLRESADLNTLRTGDADLRFYITTVQDG